MACGAGEFVGVFGCAFGDAGEEGLFGCEFFFFVAFVVFGFGFAAAAVFGGEDWQQIVVLTGTSDFYPLPLLMMCPD